MSFGLTDDGFVAKRLADIVSELDTEFRDLFGQGIKTTPDTVFGKLIGKWAEREAKLWELAESVYNSQYPNSASGQSLANIGQYSDIAPNPATRSSATVYLTGTNGLVIPKGYLIATETAMDQFRFTGNVTLSGSQFSIQGITRSGSTATAAATAHGREVGDVVLISGANQDEYNGLQTILTVADVDHFTYAVSGTPVTPATGALQGAPATAATVECTKTGPVQALAGTLNQIVNPVAGWETVDNIEDATIGNDAETDAEFRVRRIAALKGLGAARFDAILGAVLSVDGVTHAALFVNDTDDTVDGRPPHSFECLAIGGEDQDILDTIWNKKAAGIRAYGNTEGTAVDSQGGEHDVAFSRPEDIDIWLELDLTVTDDYPDDGDDLVKEKVLAYGDGLQIGDDVIVFPALMASFATIPGIVDVVVRIGTSSDPTGDNNVVISETEKAVFDSARITIFKYEA